MINASSNRFVRNRWKVPSWSDIELPSLGFNNYEGMQAQRILNFLSGIKQNNNREWFAANKSEYQAVKSDFEDGISKAIARIAEFDPSVKHLTTKDTTYRFTGILVFLQINLLIRHISAHTSQLMARKRFMVDIIFI